MPSGAYILGCAGTELTPPEAEFFASSQPWGFILFARNIETPDQLRALTKALRDSVGWHAPILIDQEGGRVQRMGAPHWREYLPALDQIEKAGEKSLRATYLRNRLIAAELFDVGIDVNCAPLADVIWPDTHPVLRNRCYGSDVATVVAHAMETARGLTEGGILPVLKHIPGYGRARVDGHIDLPRVDTPIEQLCAVDFIPFKMLNHMPMGMTAHIVFDCIDTKPATTSEPAMQMIRQDIGFGGLIMTDDISMEALSGTIAERSKASLDAGCDVILHCNSNLEEMYAVADVCGQLNPNAEDRAKRALAQRQSPTPVDISALEREFQLLIGG